MNPTQNNNKDKSNFFNNSIILITGGTGSFGRAITKKILKNYQPRKVIIFSRDECKQWEMRTSDPIFDHDCIRYFLGDVRDKERLLRSFRGVDYVVHAAALKQVPAAEYNPSEFVKTNINGAMNVIEASIDSSVKKVITLSTDKAVAPVNLYGATKLCSDKLFVAGSAYVGDQENPKFGVVRYGNVLASRGSIIQYWQNLLREGNLSLPVTDLRMTRFWISIDQAVDFVLKAFMELVGGEIFIPKIPSMKIVDLAKAIAPNAEVNVCGIREGEKLHESLINNEDARSSFEFPSHYIISPQLVTKGRLFRPNIFKEMGGVLVDEHFSYASNTNSQWLTSKELMHLFSKE